MGKSILIVEDDLTFSTMLKTWLTKQGFAVNSVSSCGKARKALQTDKYDLILSDLRLPDQSGIQLLTWLRDLPDLTPVIIMTGYADIQSAVQAIKHGAMDYIPKPIQPDELLKKINEATCIPSEPIVETKTEDLPAHPSFIEGESEAARQLYNYAQLVAPTMMSVLIIGSSGTGKEYVAQRIHGASKRCNKPFVALDCGAIPVELAASEFFGHEKGAFTGAIADKAGAFEEANGGTLFLDEIGNLSYEVQVQLLRALQERKIRRVGASSEINVDVRLICATNENLTEAIAKGKFREDLYHRINEFTLKIPDLKTRTEDILIFANFFLDQANNELNRDLIGFDAAACEALQAYSWPGNLRQMKNVVKRAALLATGNFITLDDLSDELTIKSESHSTDFSPLHDEVLERQRIMDALRQTGNNKSKAATLLGIDRKTLYNKLKHYQLE